jgi:hypothetical protein
MKLPATLTKFENDFAQKPLGLARVTDDLGAIGVLGIFGAVIGTAYLGVAAMPLILTVTVWDIFYRWKNPKPYSDAFAENLEVVKGLLRGDVRSVEEYQGKEAKASLTIETTAVTVDEEGQITPAKAAQKLLDSAVSKPLQPFLILGSPGSGKGIFACYALTLAAKEHNAEVWVLDPKADRAEAGYWAHVTRHYLKDPCLPDEGFGADIIDVVAQFEARVSARKNGTESKDSPLILFLDEVNTIATNLSKAQSVEFGAKVMGLASQARSQNAAIWLGGQCAILELLGIKGATNRDVFTAVVCAHGSQAYKAEAILSNLRMDKGLLEGLGDGHYWLTRQGAIQAPKLKQPPPTDWGNNVIDLRPARPATQSAIEIPPAPASLHTQQQPKPRFTIRTPTTRKFALPVAETSLPPKVEAAIAAHANDEKLCDFLRWIGRKSGEELTLRQVVMSGWAKKYGHGKEEITSVLAAAIAAGFLTEIDPDTYRVDC